ncbi:MAG TPA: acyl-CoA dehydrogenase [Stellaceae bacterium]|nr:acyl-CoA dehydrogenase [Stellaceae bacterium]
MSEYAAPLAEMRFALDEIAGLDGIAPDLIDAVLEGAGKLAGEVLAPLNHPGDVAGCVIENGVVRTPKGFPEAYAQFVRGGWNAISFSEELGGQNLPHSIATAVAEMWSSANVAFALCPTLTISGAAVLENFGTAEQKRLYLPQLASGEWTCAMGLTEPQAGSDLGALRTRAVPDGDRFRIKGQKIFITYGEHDWTPNIVHLVLARLPDAPPGTRGISMFLVPKFLVGPDGKLGARNDLRCVSLEHKLGIHASPTCVMAYGDNEGAIGWLVGEPNRGLHAMFTMMNRARLDVGLQGIAIAERAYQQARAYARTRVQGRPAGASESSAATPILEHADVKRMLLWLRAASEASRALAYYAAGETDRAHTAPDEAARAAAQRRVDLLIPVVKAWSSDLGLEAASTNIQVHGGMGFIEETGAAQHFRDARIALIYEGTNGIQANDLVGRKLVRDRGAAARELVADMRATVEELVAAAAGTSALGAPLAAGIDALEQATAALLATHETDAAQALAGSVPYLRLMGIVSGGWLMAKSALAALRRIEEGRGDRQFLHAKIATSRFFAEHFLPQGPALLPAIRGGATVTGFDLDLL